MRAYTVTFYTFSGMPVPLGDGLDREDAQELVRRRNGAARRRGQPVAKCGPNKWEHGEEDDCGMIGDRHGVLCVRAERPARRRRYR